MLWEEMEKYTKLTGEDATHVPIMKIGAYLDGYDKGLEVIDKIRAESSKSKTEHELQLPEKDTKSRLLISDIYCDIVNILDKYKAESEVV